jgi:hypothetical protein
VKSKSRSKSEPKSKSKQKVEFQLRANATPQDTPFPFPAMPKPILACPLAIARSMRTSVYMRSSLFIASVVASGNVQKSRCNDVHSAVPVAVPVQPTKLSSGESS